MCTLIALHRCAPGADLWVAANRDEHRGRPAEPPALRQVNGQRVVSPLDLEAGGTWWGVNQSGVFAAVTNRPVSTPDPQRRSRGQLVTDALGARSALEAAACLRSLPEGSYNPFNFFVADAREAFAATYRDAPVVWRLDPGVHVIGNADPREAAGGKVGRTRDRAVAALDRSQGARDADLREALAEICRSHDESGDPLASVCVHTRGDYGTRSSSLLKLGGAAPALYHAEGAPCANEYVTFTDLLGELGLSPARSEETTEARKAS